MQHSRSKCIQENAFTYGPVESALCIQENAFTYGPLESWVFLRL